MNDDKTSPARVCSVRIAAVLVACAAVVACGGGSPATGACVSGSGATARCGDDYTQAQCNLVNGEHFYEGRTCKDLGFR